MKLVSVLILFRKLIFEIEHYKCESQMIDAWDVWYKTSNFPSFCYGVKGSNLKRQGFPFLPFK